MKHRTLFLVFLILTLITSLSFTQPPAVTWTQTTPGCTTVYDVDQNEAEEMFLVTSNGLVSLEEDGNGGIYFEEVYVPGGEGVRSIAFGHVDELIAVSEIPDADSSGTDLIWERWFEEWEFLVIDIGYMDHPIDVDRVHTDDGYYYLLTQDLVGFMSPEFAIKLSKVNSAGDVLWSIELGPVGNNYATDLVSLPDGSCIVGGWSEGNEPYLAKVDSEGTLVWEVPSEFNWPNYSNNYVNNKYLNVRSNGNIVWTATYSELGTHYQGISVLTFDSDGQFLDGFNDLLIEENVPYPLFKNSSTLDDYDNLIAAYIFHVYDEISSKDIYLRSWSPDGEVLWTRRVGGSDFFDVDHFSWVTYTNEWGLLSIANQLAIGPYGDYLDNTMTTILDLETPEDMILELIPGDPYDPLASQWIEIPEEGGEFGFSVNLDHFAGPVQKDVWVQARNADPDVTVEIGSYLNVWLPNGFLVREGNQVVPTIVPAGFYKYTVLIGDYPWIVDAYAQLTIEKLPGTEQPASHEEFNAEGWTLTGELFGQDADNSDSSIPGAFEVSSVYPNPFNPTATVSISLPEAGNLKVSMFDCTGRLVATLVNGRHTPGKHSFAIDGNHLASGIYFIQATVPGQLNEVRKAVLMK